MRAVVVYESLFGNTREVAEAIAEGLALAGPDLDVSVLPVPAATPDAVLGADLLVVGGPTHMRGMTRGLTRSKGIQAEEKAAAEGKPGARFHPEPGAEGPGVREWFDGLPKVADGATGRRAAAFDTRVEARMAGGAAHGIAKRLRRHGYPLVSQPEGFVVTGTEGPLREGERERAASWGAALVAQTVR